MKEIKKVNSSKRLLTFVLLQIHVLLFQRIFALVVGPQTDERL